jgi:predicted AAA+ superfamily ATPase
VTIRYYKTSRIEYHEIVKELGIREGICISEEELLLEADRWELNHGGISGRTARQFITHLQGKQ